MPPLLALPRGLALGAVVLALFAQGPADAQTLHPNLAHNRWVIQYGVAQVQGRDGVLGDPQEEFHEHYVSPDLLYGPYDATDTLSMDVPSPDGTSTVHLRGVMTHSSLVTPTSIEYASSLRREAWTTGSPGPLTNAYIAAAERGSFFGTYFELDAPAQATLAIDVDVPHSHFFVEFWSVDATGTSTVLWGEDVRPSSPQASFAREVRMPLLPGQFEIHAEFEDSFALGSPAYLDRASFSLALAPVVPIPEPDTAALTLAGLALTAIAARPRRGGKARTARGDLRAEP